MTKYRKFDWNRARKDFFTFFDDFFVYNTADWTLTTTEAGAGSATEAVGNLAGGVLVVTNDAADNDLDAFQWAGGAGATKECFKFATTKKMQIVGRFKVADADQVDLMFGLYITDTDPIGGVTDGIYFRVVDGDASLTFVVEKDSSETVLDTGIDLADDTYVEVEAYYDTDSSKFQVFVNGSPCGKVALTTVPDDEELAVSFVIQNGQAVANILSVDYIGVSQQR